MTPTIQVCLVSEQPMPNLLPVLDKAHRPDKVILLVSDRMQEQATNLEQVFGRLQIKCERVFVSAYDANAIQETLLELLADNETNDISLNVTGGTKIMAIVAQDVFRGFGKPVFYINAVNDQILKMPDNTSGGAAANQFAETKLNVTLKLDILLAAHGWQVISQETPKPLEGNSLEYVKSIIENIQKPEYSGAVAMMNGLAAHSEQTRTLRFELTERENGHGSFRDLLQNAIDAGLIKEDNAYGNILYFSSPESRAFLMGVWLEHYTFDQVRRLRQKIGLQDEALNLKIEKINKLASNEMDVVFVAKNQLYVIECKTAIMKQESQTGDGTKGTDAIYKLEALAKSQGGLRTNKMLISFRELNNADIRRAKSNNIQIVGPETMRRLGEVIGEWVNK